MKINLKISPIQIGILLIMCFLSLMLIPDKNVENFKVLATNRGAEVDVKIRILINFACLLLIIIAMNFMSIFLVMKKIDYFRALLWFLVVSISFIPTVYFNDSYFRFMKRLYYYIGIGHIGRGYADLEGVLQGPTQIEEAGEYFLVDCPGSCMKYRWQYSSILLRMPLSEQLLSHLWLISLVLFLMMIGILIWAFKESFPLMGLLIFFLLPSSLLALERMNIENLLFLFIALIPAAYRSKLQLLLLPFIILVMAIVKFYPLVLALLFAFVPKIKRERLFIYFSTLLVGILMFWPDLKKIGGENLVAGYAGSYGLPNFLSLLNGNLEPSYDALSFRTIIVGIGFCFFFFTYGFRFEVINFDYRKNSHILFHLSSLLAITSWLTNSNYMYRLVLLAWAIPFLAELYNQNKQRVGLMTSLLFVGMSLIPISLSPVRNVLLGACFSMLLGLFIKTLWSSLEFKRRSNPSTLDM